MTMTMNIKDIRSVNIRSAMRDCGIHEAELLGDNGKTGDALVDVYRIGDVRVANTNGDPVWEESDPSDFAELLESEGIEL